MYRSAYRKAKNLWKRCLGVTGLASQQEAILQQQRAILQLHQKFEDRLLSFEDRFASLTTTILSQIERTRLAVGVQADVTRASVAHEGELTRTVSAAQTGTICATVCAHSDLIRSANAEQSGLTRAAIGEQSDLTRSTLIQVIQGHLDSLRLDPWRLQELEGLLRYPRRRDYLAAIRSGDLELPRLETQHPIAVSSNDTLYPRGCKNDNSICLRFNQKLITWFGSDTRLKVLDLGCAGGGMVRSFIDDGHLAIGLEGSDYPLVNQIGEWATIPHHLFTCDITKPFHLSDARTGEPLLFDVITAWEVMEHIPADSLPGLLENIDRHLAPGGQLIFSIATFLDWDTETGIKWHVTVQEQDWWINVFREAGFIVNREHPFKDGDYVRGSGHCRGDWREDSNTGFHLVLQRHSEARSMAQRESAA